MKLSFQTISVELNALQRGAVQVWAMGQPHALAYFAAPSPEGTFPVEPLRVATLPRPLRVSLAAHWVRWTGQAHPTAVLERQELAWAGEAGRQATLLDQQLVDHWHATGWLPQRPVVEQRTLARHGISGAMVSYPLGLDLPPTIGLASDSSGRLYSAPLNRRFDPALTARLHSAVYERWLNLAHEAAHVALTTQPAPFQPSGPTPLAAAFNRVVFDRANPSTTFQWFDENLADAYGAMLVLRAARLAPQAWAEGAVLRDMRAFDDATVQGVNPYRTMASLDALVAGVDQWRDLPPDQAWAWTLRCVSDVFLASLRHQPDLAAQARLDLAHPAPLASRLAEGTLWALAQDRLAAWTAELTRTWPDHPIAQHWAVQLAQPATLAHPAFQAVRGLWQAAADVPADSPIAQPRGPAFARLCHALQVQVMKSAAPALATQVAQQDQAALAAFDTWLSPLPPRRHHRP